MDTFTTIQGEGFHSGKSAHFLRIGGCDIGCHWCDIKESWNSDLYPLVKIGNIIETINPSTDLIIISGGEPLIWNMMPLTDALKKMNKKFISKLLVPIHCQVIGTGFVYLQKKISRQSLNYLKKLTN